MKKHSRFAIIFLFSISFFCGRAIAVLAHSISLSSKSSATIVIDPGHGGNDPGKVSESGLLEKDINLEIALHLEKLLKNKGYNVILTRDQDKELASDKSQDLSKRVKLMSDKDVDLVVSIHQNSFSSPESCGPQVFYYTNSKEGSKLATCISNTINSSLEIEKPREIQENSDYYILKNSSKPTIIVECGFLSNPKEAELLSDSSYQQKLARAIYFGIVSYFNQQMS